MYDTYDEVEKSCKRITKELHDLNKKLANDESTISKEDVDLMDKMLHSIASSKKSMLMIDQADDMNGSSGVSNGYSNMWNRRLMTNNGMSGRRSSRNRGYSRDSEKDIMMQKLNNMYQDARDDQEADVIERMMNELSR